VTKALVELLESKGENLAHIKNHSAALEGHLRLFEEDFAASPESLQNDLDFVADCLPP
jgi:hypothetical protein